MHNTYTSNVLKIIGGLEIPEHLTASSPAKISLHDNNSFSMLAGPKFGCPGATKACGNCYAMKGHHHMPNVQAALAKNYLLVKHLDKKRATETLVQKLLDIIPDKAKIFRIHESSDMFSQHYVNVWAEVVRRKPNVLFWTYTRSFKFDFTQLTRNKNFALWASTDQYNIEKAKQFVRRFRKSGTKHAYGPWKHDEPIPPSSIICPVSAKKITVDGACESCMLCVVKKRTNKNIVFLEH